MPTKVTKESVVVQSEQDEAPVPMQPKKKTGRQTLQQIFSASMNTLATHPKLCLKLIKIYQRAEFESFFKEFIELLKICLVVGEKHPHVERTLAFVARFTTAEKQEKEDKENKNADDEREKNKDDSSSTSAATNEEMEEEDEIDPFLIKMFLFLLNNHEANSNSVRYRVCQLINRILNSMGESASLDDDLFSTIYDTMLQRLMDKKPAVRVQAIHALNRLQDPRNKDCPVIEAYRYHLSMDPSSDVRRAALSSIAITFQTLPDVLHRTRDKNPLARRQAYLVLAQKVHIRSLQISQRVQLLSEGLNDRSDMVRMAVQKNLLQAWLRFVNGSVLDLLTCLDVEASTKGAELALDTLFIDVPVATLVQNFGLLGENRVLPYDTLKPESVLYWKCLVKHLKKEAAEDELDLMLPDLSEFCVYIRDFALAEVLEEGDEQVTAVRQMEKEFVLQQLVQITICYDLSDEVGRQALDQLVRSLLVSERVGECSINGLVDIFGRLYPPNSRVHQLAEIISDVREPAPAAEASSSTVAEAAAEVTAEVVLSEEEQRAQKIKIAKVRVQLNQVREELEECVRSLDLDRAQGLKLELRALEVEHETIQQQIATPAQTPRARPASDVPTPAPSQPTSTAAEDQQEPQFKDDPQTLSRCLTIVCQMLKSPEITVVTPTLHSLHDNLLLPCLKNQEPLVRKLAVQALSLVCLVSKELAQKHLLLFVQISQIDVEAIQILALQAVFDFLLLYGVDEFTAASQDVSQLPGLLGQEEEEGGLDAANTVIAILSKRLDSDECEVRTAVAMGLCKLLQAGRITSHKLLTHLTLLWYNPLTEDDNMLRHMLGVFFPLYSSHGGACQEAVCASVLPTLRSLMEAPARSPLAEVDIDDVANFLVSITSPALLTRKAGQHVNMHDSLVFSVCSEILAFPEGPLVRHLVRMLRHLSLTPSNYTNLRQIHALADKMLKKLREKPQIAAVEKFRANITEHLKLDPVKEEPEDEPAVNVDEPAAPPDDVTEANKTTDVTFSRRKRQLYTSQIDNDILSSEAESEVDSVACSEKTVNIDEIKNDVDNTLKTGPSDDDSADPANVTVISALQDQEVELTLVARKSICSDDMFSSSEVTDPASVDDKKTPLKSGGKDSTSDKKTPLKSEGKDSTSPDKKTPLKSGDKEFTSPAKKTPLKGTLHSGGSPAMSPIRRRSKGGRTPRYLINLLNDTDDSSFVVDTSSTADSTVTEESDWSPVKSKRSGRKAATPKPARSHGDAATAAASRSDRNRRHNTCAATTSDSSTDDDDAVLETPSKKRGARAIRSPNTPTRKLIKTGATTASPAKQSTPKVDTADFPTKQSTSSSNTKTSNTTTIPPTSLVEVIENSPDKASKSATPSPVKSSSTRSQSPVPGRSTRASKDISIDSSIRPTKPTKPTKPATRTAKPSLPSSSETSDNIQLDTPTKSKKSVTKISSSKFTTPSPPESSSSAHNKDHSTVGSTPGKNPSIETSKNDTPFSAAMRRNIRGRPAKNVATSAVSAVPDSGSSGCSPARPVTERLRGAISDSSSQQSSEPTTDQSAEGSRRTRGKKLGTTRQVQETPSSGSSATSVPRSTRASRRN